MSYSAPFLVRGEFAGRVGNKMSYSFVHTQRPQFPLRVLFLGRTDALEDACPLSDGGCDRERVPFVATGRQKRAEDDAQLLAHIETVHDDSKGRCGSPRVYRELRATGVRCSRHRVARLMRAAGRRGRGKRRSKSTTDSGHALPVAENLLMRQFEVAEPNLVWAADMTFIRTTEGWLYLGSVWLKFQSQRMMQATCTAAKNWCPRFS